MPAWAIARDAPASSHSGPRQLVRWAIVAAIAAVIGVYYWWAVRASGDSLFWKADLNGYYNLLARGFVSGHLYLPIQPAPELLALSNPWDPSVDRTLKLHDAVLYNGHYYLYFGATPAVLLFTPWRLLSGHDLPERFAIFLLAFGGFLFSCGALLRLFDLAKLTPGPLLLAILAIGLGVCQSVPYLLNRVAIYEIAIAGGYFCVSAAVFCLTRGLDVRGRPDWLTAAGLMYGCAVGCRPHLVFAGVIALAGLIWFLAKSRGLTAAILSRECRAFAAAFLLVGLAIAVYNYERFGNPLEFGLRYQLSGPGQNRIELAFRNLLPGSYYMLLAPPYFSPVFPWIRMVRHFIFSSPDRFPYPPEYFIEPTVGALWMAPAILVAPFAPFFVRATREVSVILTIVSLSSLTVLLFLISTHLASHRYETDFAASAVFAAVVSLSIAYCRASGWRRVAAIAVLAIAIGYGAIANLALGLAGPYDEILKNRPKRYVRIAGWFSPFWEFRPVIDPRIEVDLRVTFPSSGPGYSEPVISIGHSHYTDSLLTENLGNAVRFSSVADGSKMTYEMPHPGGKPVTVRLAYSPNAHLLTVEIDGGRVIAQPIKMIISAPAEIRIGDNLGDPARAGPRFTGLIQILRKNFQ
jgi:hypothetical protein